MFRSEGKRKGGGDCLFFRGVSVGGNEFKWVGVRIGSHQVYCQILIKFVEMKWAVTLNTIGHTNLACQVVKKYLYQNFILHVSVVTILQVVWFNLTCCW